MNTKKIITLAVAGTLATTAFADEAFDKAMNSRRLVVPGDPIVTKDNHDELEEEEEVLDKLFGGRNDKTKNDIGPENVWNLYGDMINFSKEEFVAFYNYVKENGY